jgi:hypothetical protein
MNHNIQNNYIKNILLGDKSYSSVVMKIVDLVENVRTDTIAGNELLKKMWTSLNESKTPIITLRQFMPDGAELSNTDAKLKDVIDFVKKNTEDNVDLNFLINLSKEEHFQNLMKNGHISPEITVETIREEFDKSSGEIEKKINEGIFDSLQSDLLGNIKKSLKPETPQIEETDGMVPVAGLNESDQQSPMFRGHFAKYNPVGVMLSGNGGNNSAIVEGKILQFCGDGIGGITTKIVDPKSISIPENHFKLVKAIEQTPYNPETNEFTTSQKWDFPISLKHDGKVVTKKTDGTEIEIKPEDVQQLFIESLNEYDKNFSLIGTYDKKRYIEDADNFNILVQNSGSLVKFSNLEVVRNLNENTFVMYDSNIHNNSPKVLFNGLEDNKSYESYANLVEDCNRQLNDTNLFESIVFQELTNEREIFQNKINRIQKLNENNNAISREISNINSLRQVAEIGSPYMLKLNSMLESLNEKMDINISELQQLNNVDIYKY